MENDISNHESFEKLSNNLILNNSTNNNNMNIKRAAGDKMKISEIDKKKI